MAVSANDPWPTGRPAPSAPAAPGGAAEELPAGTIALRASKIEKSFGVTRAVTGCTLELKVGEVHVLMGENGSGKSTMVKMLSGVHRPDRGLMMIDGVEHTHLASPRAAELAGVATVFQEILVAPQRSVLDNVWLGERGVVRYPLSGERRRELAAEMIGRLIEVPDLDRPVGELGLNDRQAICIARALLREPKVLILDEATSALDITTRDNLFVVLDELRARGAAVLFISHRMDEVERIADRVTVMRSGSDVSTAARGQFDSKQLIRDMVGAEHAVTRGDRERRTSTSADEVRLRVSGLRLRPGAAPVDLEIRAGEIVGVAGLEGHGQDEFLRALYGDRAADGRIVSVGIGLELEISSRARALSAGIAYVPRDRRDEAIFPSLSTLENFGIASTAADRQRGFLRWASTLNRFMSFVEQMRIVARHPGNRITTLSGGNQQKVIIARWLATQPRVLVLNDPTRGVDLGAKRDIYEVLTALATAGTAVVMLSTELIELIELMDRVLVFREGSVFSEIPQAELSRNRLVASYFGQEAR